jgi:hypothetical protein
MESLEWLIIAHPGTAYKPNVYKEKKPTETEVARAYENMTQHFDCFVGVADEYAPFKNKPDLVQAQGRKHWREWTLAIFADQHITRFGNVVGDFNSTYYLFTVGPEVQPKREDSGNLRMPDLEAVQILAKSGVREAAKEIEGFYKQAGWLAKAIEPVNSIGRLFIDKPAWHGRPYTIITPLSLKIFGLSIGYNSKSLGFFHYSK